MIFFALEKGVLSLKSLEIAKFIFRIRNDTAFSKCL